MPQIKGKLRTFQYHTKKCSAKKSAKRGKSWEFARPKMLLVHQSEGRKNISGKMKEQ